MQRMDNQTFEDAVCPVPFPHQDQIIMGHGSGGRLTRDLISKIFLPHFSNPHLLAGNDFATLENQTGRLIVSTDAHIVAPIQFPGGDIGRLAVCGTVNDVAVSGAIPRYLTASFILEEGLSIALLEKIVISMQDAAVEAGITIVTGDTKVVEKGKVDGLFISTTGLAWLPEGREIRGDLAQPGDAVLISGTIGDHGIAVLSARGDLGLETEVCSDVAPMNLMIQDLLKVVPGIHVLRDPTRGGLASTLNEIALQSSVGIWLDENKIPVLPAVRTTCELLGFDPMYIANEGKLIVIVPEIFADKALSTLKKNEYGRNC
jgi:hydrogenase expression/formation protein HypE